MTNLDQAWSAWRALSRAERAQFLVLLREAYGREREARARANGGGACGERPSSLGQLALSESDIERLRA